LMFLIPSTKVVTKVTTRVIKLMFINQRQHYRSNTVVNLGETFVWTNTAFMK